MLGFNQGSKTAEASMLLNVPAGTNADRYFQLNLIQHIMVMCLLGRCVAFWPSLLCISVVL